MTAHPGSGLPTSPPDGVSPPEPHLDRRLPPLTRALIGPPGRWLLSGATLAGLVMLYGSSAPGGHFTAELLAALVAFVLVAVWVPRFAVGLFRADGRPGLRRHWPRWAAAPVLGVAVVVLVHLDVPLTARFALSEASMERLAREVAAGTESGGDTRWAGLFPVSPAGPVEGGGASLAVPGTGFLNTHGFAWSPGGKPEDAGDVSYRHLRGHWYEWTAGW